MKNLDLAKYIGEKIRTYRKQAKLTQEELASKLDTKKATISNYETGYRSPQQDTLFEIAKVLDISINDLFPPTVTKKEKSSIQTIYNQLEEHRQNEVLEFAKEKLHEQKIEKALESDDITDEELDLLGDEVIKRYGIQALENLIKIVHSKRNSDDSSNTAS